LNILAILVLNKNIWASTCPAALEQNNFVILEPNEAERCTILQPMWQAGIVVTKTQEMGT
jgi:hypothetical protein